MTEPYGVDDSMLFCKCGAYLLWERDHWACMDCGNSPWRCDCKPIERYEAATEAVKDAKLEETIGAEPPDAALLEKAKKRIRALKGD